MTRSSWRMARRTVWARAVQSTPSGVTWLPSWIDARLQTAVCWLSVTSRISVHRLDRWTTYRPSAAWLQVRLAASLKHIHPLPVWARVRIMRAYSSLARTVRAALPARSASA